MLTNFSMLQVSDICVFALTVLSARFTWLSASVVIGHWVLNFGFPMFYNTQAHVKTTLNYMYCTLLLVQQLHWFMHCKQSWRRHRHCAVKRNKDTSGQLKLAGTAQIEFALCCLNAGKLLLIVYVLKHGVIGLASLVM